MDSQQPDSREEPLSRTAYRKQQRQAKRAVTSQSPSDQEQASAVHREEMVNGQAKLSAPEKTARLKKRLNIAIAALIVAIIIVYLILFFVG